MSFFKGLIAALWITACLWAIYHIGHANGFESAECHKKHNYEFKTAKAAFIKKPRHMSREQGSRYENQY